MTEQFAQHLSDFAVGRTQFDAFQDWFIDYVMSPTGVNPEDQSTAYDIENAMAEMTGGHIDLEEFRGVVRQHLRDLTIVSSFFESPAIDRRSFAAGRTLQIQLLAANG